jgi:hypothetical protein
MFISKSIWLSHIVNMIQKSHVVHNRPPIIFVGNDLVTNYTNFKKEQIILASKA